MKLVLCGVAGAVLSMPAMADVISYGELEYETVDWISSPEVSTSVSGSVGGVGVTFSSVGMTGDAPSAYDFGSDASFDALSFGTGMSESISLFGGMVGLSGLTFDQSVDSVLILIGAPGAYSGTTHFGSSLWDFDDDIGMEVIDGEGPGFSIGDDNVLSNEGWGPTSQISGVVGFFGDGMTLLEWMQDTENGVDKLQLSIAVSVPAPASGLALLLPAALYGRRRR